MTLDEMVSYFPLVRADKGANENDCLPSKAEVGRHPGALDFAAMGRNGSDMRNAFCIGHDVVLSGGN